MSTENNQKLREAVIAVKAGNRTQARHLLYQLLKQDPSHEKAWLWLSELEPELTDKIKALKTALAINPDRPKAIARLKQLEQQQAAQKPSPQEPDTPLPDPSPPPLPPFKQAQAALTAGQKEEAYAILSDLVQQSPNYEEAWYLLSTITPDVDEELEAILHVLRLNPQHTAAKRRQQEIKNSQADYLSLGRAYEAQGELEQAYVTYEAAAKYAVGPARREAERRLIGLKHLLQKQNYPHLREVNPTVTLLRLTIGPPILYSLLIFIHSGLNPTQFSPLLCFSGLPLLIGSFLLSAAETSDHPLWQMWFNRSEPIKPFS